MKPRFCLLYGLSLFLFILPVAYAQAVKADSSKVENTKAVSKVEFIQDSKITDLLNKDQTVNEKKDGKVKGYRVQIHFGSDRDKAKEIKLKFTQKFPSVSSYEKYDLPNFKVRVGDFRTRIEAYKFLKEITADFPSSFLVQDEIELSELLK
jgi:hypothetical protein